MTTKQLIELKETVEEEWKGSGLVLCIHQYAEVIRELTLRSEETE